MGTTAPMCGSQIAICTWEPPEGVEHPAAPIKPFIHEPFGAVSSPPVAHLDEWREKQDAIYTCLR